MKVDERQFRKMFPQLAQEMESRENKMAITSIRPDAKTGEKPTPKQFEDYDPDIIDFIRRCDNEKQAEEIIEYLEQKQEISREYAGDLRKQLKEQGVRSFGPKKEADYYLRQAGL